MRVIPAAVVLAVLCVEPGAAHVSALPLRAQSVRNATIVQTTTRQIHLSLQLQKAVYPRNALVLTTVRLTNNSARPISTWDCLRSSLGAEVPRSNGEGDLYPPLIPPPGAPWAGCPGELAMGGIRRMTTTIAVSQTLTRTSYVVLRGLSVRGWAQLMTSPGQGKPTMLQTPLIHIHPAPAAGPAVRLRTGPSISVHVIPVTAGGPLLYSEYASCRTLEPNRPLTVSATFSRWYRASKTVLYPFHRSCSSLLEWMLFVAQPGRPIARVYYCAQHDRCIYAPPTPQELGIARCKVDIARAVVGGHLPASSARYAIGISSVLPSSLTPRQQALAKKFRARCAGLLARRRL